MKVRDWLVEKSFNHLDVLGICVATLQLHDERYIEAAIFAVTIAGVSVWLEG